MYLYGASGHAKVIMDILRQNGIEDTGIAGNSYWFFDLYNNKPAEAKMMLLG